MEETNYTLATWLEEWYKTYKAPAVKPKTSEMYLNIIRIINLQKYSQNDIKDISEMELQKTVNSISVSKTGRQGEYGGKGIYSASVMKKVLLTLDQALKAAVRIGLIDRNPASDLILPHSPTKEILPLTHAEEERIVDVCRCDLFGHIFIFLLKTGLRMHEVINLKWSDYDAQHSRIFIRKSKTKAGVRTVYLIKEAQNIIERQPRINKHIFNSSIGQPLSKTVMQKSCVRIRTAAGVPHFTTHVCRHTFVTRMCEKGVPAKAIAEIIGHAQAGYVLDIYAKMEQETLRKAIYALEKDEA